MSRRRIIAWVVASELVGTGVVFWLGWSAGVNAVCRAAVSAGRAEWVPGADGRPEFRWKAPGGPRP